MHNLSEDFIIKETKSEKYEVWQYLYGNCHLFALLLSELNDLKIGGFFRLDDNDDIEGIEHVFCYDPKNPNIAIDCRGNVSLNFLINEYHNDYVFSTTIMDCKPIIKKWIKEGNLNNYKEGEKEILEYFIKDMNKKYGTFNLNKKKRSNKIRF